MITRADIEARRAELVKARVTAQAQMHAASGAIALADGLLEEIAKREKEKPAKPKKD